MQKYFLYFILIFISSISASNYYVSNNGDDNNPGTLQSPFLTIQKAADIMTAGDVCYIRQGSYHEAIIMNNNDGLEKILKRIKSYKGNLVIGANIGKNKNTPNDEAINDYQNGTFAKY